MYRAAPCCAAPPTNAAEVCRVLSAGEEAPDAAMLPEPGALVVWRSGYVSCQRAADAIEADALAALGEPGSFDTVCGLLAEPVMLAHDFGYGIDSFARSASLLAAAGLRVLMPQARGHGATRFLATRLLGRTRSGATAPHASSEGNRRRSRSPPSS